MNVDRELSPVTVVSSLRSLMPDRALDYITARTVAEAQANRLLEGLRMDSPPFDTALIEDLPRLDVRVLPSLPGSGMSHWNRGLWRIHLNGSEPLVRRRFTLAHEFKHVLDAPFEEVIYRHLRSGTGRDPAVEAICDHFAACLLMPKKLVKRAFFAGTQDPAALAWHFDVSAQAMSYRLHQLGLTDPTPRCGGVRLTVQNRRPRRYFRSFSSSYQAQRTTTGAAA